MIEYIQQKNDQPAFPDIEWEKPQNRRQKGELLIVGGSHHGFASVANSYEYSKQAGIGRTTVLMPEAIKASVQSFIDNLEFLPSTPSGSFSKKGLSNLESLAKANMATLLAGDFGRNSETASLIEAFLMTSKSKIIITKDAVDYAISSYPRQVLRRQETIIVASLAQLQKLIKMAAMKKNIKFEMGITQIANFLANLSVEVSSVIITMHHNHIFLAYGGKVSSTKVISEDRLWQTQTAAFSSVYWIQHPEKTFQALTSAIYEVASSQE